jgi:hypothetical protein
VITQALPVFICVVSAHFFLWVSPDLEFTSAAHCNGADDAVGIRSRNDGGAECAQPQFSIAGQVAIYGQGWGFRLWWRSPYFPRRNSIPLG